MARPYALFMTRPADLKGLGLRSKLPTLIRHVEKANADREEGFDWTPLLDRAKALRAMGPAAAHAVDQTLVRERGIALVERLLGEGTFAFDAPLTTRGLAIHSPITGADQDLWAFAQRHGTEDTLLKDHDAFRMLPLDGWSFFGERALANPARFFAVNNGTTNSEHLCGCTRIEDADLAVYGRAIEQLFQALLWWEQNQSHTNVVRDKGPGWNLRTEAALQTALLAGWPTHILAQRWTSMVRNTAGTMPNSPKGPRAWGNALLSAHGQMALAGKVARMVDAERWKAIGTLWRTHGWEKQKLGKMKHTIRNTPVLRDLFVPG